MTDLEQLATEAYVYGFPIVFNLGQAFPPAQAERDFQQKFAPLGLLDATSPYTSPSAELRDAIRAGFKAGKELVEENTSNGSTPVQNGWRLTYHAFDYNLDHFGPGTVDDPQWIIPDRRIAHVVRAAAARGGLWGNHGYEAAYPAAWVDGAGQPLDGTRPYTVRFETLPPVRSGL